MDGLHCKVRSIDFIFYVFNRFTESQKCLLCSSVTIFLLHALNLAFAKIPVGRHTACACVAASVVIVCVSVLLRSIIETIVPFEVVFVAFLGLILCDILYGMIKFIPVKDERTGQTKRWAIGTCIFAMSFCRLSIFVSESNTHKQQVPGFTCPRHIVSISKRELV